MTRRHGSAQVQTIGHEQAHHGLHWATDTGASKYNVVQTALQSCAKA